MKSKNDKNHTTFRSKRPVDPVQDLRKRWNSLTPLQRGARLRVLVRQGRTGRALASKLRCSEATIRKCLLLADLTTEEKNALQEGRLGANEALRRVRGRKKAGRLQVRTPTEAEKRAFIKKCGSLLAQFVSDRIAAVDQECFFQEVQARLNWLWTQESRRSRTERTVIELAVNPHKTLASCQPERAEPTELPAQVSYYADWIAIWLGRIVSVAEIRDAIMRYVVTSTRPR
jgi:DNA-binding MarR family transcriptional regulator